MIFISIALNIILLVLLHQAKSELNKKRSAKIKIENLRKDETLVPILKLTFPNFIGCETVDLTRVSMIEEPGLLYDDNMNRMQNLYLADSYCMLDYMKINAINEISVYGNTWIYKERTNAPN